MDPDCPLKVSCSEVTVQPRIRASSAQQLFQMWISLTIFKFFYLVLGWKDNGEVQTIRYKVSYKDIKDNTGNVANIL